MRRRVACFGVCGGLMLGVVGCSGKASVSHPASNTGSGTSSLTSVSRPETTPVSPGPVECTNQRGPVDRIASQRELDHVVDFGSQVFEPPSTSKPTIDAQSALRSAEAVGPGFLGDPVDAVLATMRSPQVSSELVWALTVQQVLGGPTIGQPRCTDVASIVDATDGHAVAGLEGVSFR